MTENQFTKLYKYQSFNKQSISNLINRIIYFSNPTNFNDPFDCAETIKFQEPTLDELKAIRVSGDDGPVTLPKGEAKEYYRHVKESWRKARLNVLSHIGIACFSITKADNILMWSHYADKHQGFCLEFDSQFPPFNKVERVIYSQKYNEVSALDLLRSQVDPNYRKNIPTLWSDKITKSPCWKYEQEYRIFDDANKLNEYDPLALTGIYFGLRMPEKDKETIINILKNTNTSFFNMEKVNSEFKVTAVPYI
jgi:hypothetical protein